MQTATARLLTGACRREHVTPISASLRWFQFSSDKLHFSMPSVSNDQMMTFRILRLFVDLSVYYNSIRSLHCWIVCFAPSRSAGNEAGDFREYDPNLLDDPQWPCGKHKRVLIFPSYMVSVRYFSRSRAGKLLNKSEACFSGQSLRFRLMLTGPRVYSRVQN